MIGVYVEVHEDKGVINRITEDQEKGRRRVFPAGVRRYGCSRGREKREPRKRGVKAMCRKGPCITIPHFKSQLYLVKEGTTSKLHSFSVPQFLTYQSGKIVIIASNVMRRLIGKVCLRALSIGPGTQ